MNAIKVVLGGFFVSSAFVSLSHTAMAGGVKGEATDDDYMGEVVALPGDWNSDDLQVYDTCDAATTVFENIWEEYYCIALVEDSMDLKTIEEREDYVFADVESLLPAELSSGECYSNLVGRFWECVDEGSRFEQNICLNRAVRTYNDCLISVDEEVSK